MAIVDRYKKSGGFVQLLQVLETCAPKKQEQFMSIIKEETPNWSEAIYRKMLSFEKIISWQPEPLLEIVANVNSLAFVTALKSLPADKFNSFCQKLSSHERRKIEQKYNDLNPDINQISSCVMKVVSETRSLFVSGALKFDKIDITLLIPENIELQLESSGPQSGPSGAEISAQVSVNAPSAAGVLDFEQLKKKYIELNQLLNTLKKENTVMKEKLDRIKKIA